GERGRYRQGIEARFEPPDGSVRAGGPGRAGHAPLDPALPASHARREVPAVSVDGAVRGRRPPRAEERPRRVRGSRGGEHRRVVSEAGRHPRPSRDGALTSTKRSRPPRGRPTEQGNRVARAAGKKPTRRKSAGTSARSVRSGASRANPKRGAAAKQRVAKARAAKGPAAKGRAAKPRAARRVTAQRTPAKRRAVARAPR